LAHLLQALAAGLILSGGAVAAPFSHATHLKLKLTCVTCHTAAPSSTKASDNLLPAAAICGGCHKDNRAAAIKQPRSTGVTKFNHQLHVKLGNIAPVLAKAIDSRTYLGDPGQVRPFLNTTNQCVACHRGLETSAEVTPANFPRMADCLVCHNRIEPPYSCEKCHDDIKSLTPATHDAKWGDVHTSPKIPKDPCAGCHGRRFTCQGCH
jgi:Cytochrome c7 and related cytochrome c